MGNCLSTPQPIPAKPAPKAGEPVNDQELAQLRSEIEAAERKLLALADKLPPLKAALADIPSKIEGNKSVVDQVVQGIAPIDNEIASRLPMDSDAEATVCSERKVEIKSLVDIADGFDGQKQPAVSVDTGISEMLNELQTLVSTLENLRVRAEKFTAELTRVNELISQCGSQQQEAHAVEPESKSTREAATIQEDEFNPVCERLNRYASQEVVEESMAYQGAEEAVVAAEMIDDFRGVEEFFDEGTYSRWLSESSLLAKAYKLYNQPGYEKSDLATVIGTFERLMLEKAETDAKTLATNERPLDLDYYVVSNLLNSENGQQRLCSFVSGLLDAVQQGQYPEVIARILGISNKNSAAPSWAGFVPEIFKRFDKLFNFMKISRQVNSRLFEESDLDTVPELLCGGQIKLSAIVDELFSIFSSAPASALTWIRRLKPASITDENFLLYLLCNRMKSINTDSNKLFKELCSERVLELKDFTSGLKTKLNLQLTEEEFQIIFDRIDRTHAGTIARVYFTQEVKIPWYYELNSKSEFTISKYQFFETFLAVGQEYMTTVAWQTYLATKSLRSSTFEYPSDRIEDVARAMEESNTSGLLQKIQESGGQPGDDKFSIDELIRYVLRRPFGLLSQYALSPSLCLPHGDLTDEVKSIMEALAS